MNDNYQLNSDQIDRLFLVCKEKNVPYIDVQYELVDHLASSIEDAICNNTKLTFEAALTIELNKYPITGFYKFIEEKEKGLSKYWRLKIWNLLVCYFKFPKILLTIACALLYFMLVNLFGAVALYVIVAGMLILTFLSRFSLNALVKDFLIESQVPFYEKLIESEGPKFKYLFVQTFNSIFTFIGFPPVIVIWLLDVSNYSLSSAMIASVVVILSLFTVWIHASFTYLPNMLIKEINNKYNHFNMQIAN